jgi:hypothetical protein
MFWRGLAETAASPFSATATAFLQSWIYLKGEAALPSKGQTPLLTTTCRSHVNGWKTTTPIAGVRSTARPRFTNSRESVANILARREIGRLAKLSGHAGTGKARQAHEPTPAVNKKARVGEPTSARNQLAKKKATKEGPARGAA